MNMETVLIIYKNTNFTCWRFMSGRQVYLYARKGFKGSETAMRSHYCFVNSVKSILIP